MAKSKSFGSKLQRKNASTWDDIPQLIDVKPPSESVETIDVTTHDSASGYREIVASFKSGGTCAASFLYDPTNTVQTALHTDYTSSTLNTYRVVFPGSPAYHCEFDAFVTEWTPESLTIDGTVKTSITLTVTGPVTIATGA